MKFSLLTDHKPLTFIFGKKKELPQVVANCLERYAFFLSGFDYKIKYIPSKSIMQLKIILMLIVSSGGEY